MQVKLRYLVLNIKQEIQGTLSYPPFLFSLVYWLDKEVIQGTVHPSRVYKIDYFICPLSHNWKG